MIVGTVERKDGNLVELSTVAEATDFLARLLRGDVPEESLPDDVVFSGELSELKIEIEGADYHSTITGNLARGIWELQQEVYRAAAHSLYGIDTIKKLPKSDLESYNLVFEVDEGCSKLVASLERMVGHLKDGINGMDSLHRLILLVSVPLIVAGGIGLTWAKLASIDAELQLQLEQEKTAQMRIVKDAAQQVPTVSRWIDASTNGAKSIAKAAYDAERLEIGQEAATAAEISEINRRASREIPDEFNVLGYFRVMRIAAPTSDGLVRLDLSGNGEEFSALIDLNSTKHPVSEDQKIALFLAPKDGKRLFMNVRLKKASDGIREAIVEGFPNPQTSN